MTTPQQELKTLLHYITLVDGSLLLFCTYTHLDDIRVTAQSCNPPPEWIDVRPDGWAFFAALKRQDPRPVFVVLRYELSPDLRAFGEYVDLHREELLRAARTVVVWIPNRMVRDFLRSAPNFWSWNTGGLFELAELSSPKKAGEEVRQGMSNSSDLEIPLTPTAQEAILQRLEIEQATLEAQQIRLESHPRRKADLLLRVADLEGMLGRRQNAYQHTLQATQLYRSLTQQTPDAFTPDLAMSLNNLGIRLGDLGDRERALEATREATEIYRALAARNPDAFTPNLATSLNNLGVRLGDLGDREGALGATREAVELRRVLAARNPDTFTPDLAGSLNNLGIRLGDLRDREGALEATREAVELRRVLAARNPDTFTPDLAGSLNNLGVSLGDLGDREGALEATREAVELRRALAARNPDAFTPDLALSLNNLGVRLGDLGDREGALGATREAVELRRALAARNPDAFTPNLALSLNNLGDQLAQSGDWKTALLFYKEAVYLIRPYAERYSASFKMYFNFYKEDYMRACEETGTLPDSEAIVDIPS